MTGEPCRFDIRAWDAIAFDCDGVLLDSNGMKIEAFRQTLIGEGFASEVVEAFSANQRISFGVSRHRLFTELLDGRFGECPPGVDMARLLTRFGQASLSGYLTAPLTDGAVELLGNLRGKPLFVASGSDQAELRTVFDLRGLSHHFVSVLGSPTGKADHLLAIRSDLPPGARLLMVGDAIADRLAARSAGADFVFVSAYSTVRESMLALSEREHFVVLETLAQALPLSD